MKKKEEKNTYKEGVVGKHNGKDEIPRWDGLPLPNRLKGRGCSFEWGGKERRKIWAISIGWLPLKNRLKGRGCGVEWGEKAWRTSGEREREREQSMGHPNSLELPHYRLMLEQVKSQNRLTYFINEPK